MGKKALLIVDVQNGLLNKTSNVYNAHKLIENINLLEYKARQAGVPIAYIQHENNILVEGSHDWELHPGLNPTEDDLFVKKTKSCSFDNNNLKKQLLSRGVDEVVVCGLVSHGCVKRTCLGGADHGFNVFLASDAHSNWRKNAAELIEQVNLELDSQGIIIETSDQVAFTHLRIVK